MARRTRDLWAPRPAKYLYPGHRAPYQITALERIRRNFQDQRRLNLLFNRAKFPGWIFTLDENSNPRTFRAFRPDPADPHAMELVGPWTLPDDAGSEEIELATRAAVLAIEGPQRVHEFRFLPPK
jgi:hypothetical protein